MPKTAIAAVVVAAALVIGAWSHPAAAIGPVAMGPVASAALPTAGGYNAPVTLVRYVRHGWRQRRYWRWDHRPIWDDPWEVLQPTIWGSPEPHVVPADVWARKWHPARWHYGAHHHHP
jgi:hypothetical protein